MNLKQELDKYNSAHHRTEKITISHLARELGVSRQQVYNYIDGVNKMPKLVIEKLESIFKIK